MIFPSLGYPIAATTGSPGGLKRPARSKLLRLFWWPRDVPSVPATETPDTEPPRTGRTANPLAQPLS
jgi:hypothetical protein